MISLQKCMMDGLSVERIAALNIWSANLFSSFYGAIKSCDFDF